MPADTLVKCHELFGQVEDHFLGNVGQIESFTQSDVLSKPNHPGEASRDVDAKLGNQTMQIVD